MSWVLLIWLHLLSLCSWAGMPTAPQASNVRLPEEKPSYTAAQATAYARQVLPLVEEFAGRKLVRVPPFKLVTRQQFIRDTMNKRHPAGETSNRKSRIWANYAFGAYDPPSTTVYLLPGNFRPRLRRAGVAPEHYQAILLMVIAHELTHALQDQEVGLPSLYRRAGPGVRYAVEGHAKFVMDKVAEAISAKDAVHEFEKTIGVGLVRPAGRSVGSISSLGETERNAYVDGGRFISWHYRHGGSERVWQILKAPPAKVSVIIHPETYSK